MSRYTGPKLKIIRKLGKLPGFTRKFAKEKKLIEKKKLSKPSPYKIRLFEKQKLRYNYGLTERQLLKYVKQAKLRPGMTGFLIMQFLEMRFDNIIFRLGIAPTIQAARQFINHGHFLINNKKVNIPSFNCCPNDKISLRNKTTSKELIKTNLKPIKLPKHLEFDSENLIGSIIGFIDHDDLGIQVNELSIIEYYSRIL
jgi:small subunit ribosomal protein S4